jgi:hypothetical protein
LTPLTKQGYVFGGVFAHHATGVLGQGDNHLKSQMLASYALVMRDHVQAELKEGIEHGLEKFGRYLGYFD